MISLGKICRYVHPLAWRWTEEARYTCAIVTTKIIIVVVVDSVGV